MPRARSGARGRARRADIHAPLANRLGIWQLKWETGGPRVPLPAARDLQAHRPAARRQAAPIASATSGGHGRDCARRSREAGIAAEIAGRPKHIYSIWKKMQRKDLDFERALRHARAARAGRRPSPTATPRSAWCTACGRTVPGEFDDYIAKPKDNHYRSLHTAVIGPEGRPLEVQIRTHDMHEHAELGVAAHWRYKEGGKADAALRAQDRLDARSCSSPSATHRRRRGLAGRHAAPSCSRTASTC